MSPRPTGASAATPSPASSAGPPATSDAVQATGPTYAVVEPDDTLTGIGQRYGLTVEALLAANPSIVDRSLIRVGDRITIPGTLFTGGNVTVIDNLGAATPQMTFWVTFGTVGYSGPWFSLAQPTRITEIGAFVYDLDQGRDRGPFTLEICLALRDFFHPPEEAEYVADCDPPLATFAVPRPVPGVAAYEAVAPDLILPAGDYFAIYTDASLMWGAQEPFRYTPPSIPSWDIGNGYNPFTKSPFAVRILGRALVASAPTLAPLPKPPLPCATSTGPPGHTAAPGSPELTLEEAAEAYRAVMMESYSADEPYRKLVPCAEGTGACTRAQLQAGRAAWAAAAAKSRTYLAVVQAIRFPAAVASEVGAFVTAAERTHCLEDAAGKATRVETLNALAAAAQAANEALFEPEDALTQALGITFGCGCGESEESSSSP